MFKLVNKYGRGDIKTDFEDETKFDVNCSVILCIPNIICARNLTVKLWISCECFFYHYLIKYRLILVRLTCYYDVIFDISVGQFMLTLIYYESLTFYQK